MVSLVLESERFCLMGFVSRGVKSKGAWGRTEITMMAVVNGRRQWSLWFHLALLDYPWNRQQNRSSGLT